MGLSLLQHLGGIWAGSVRAEVKMWRMQVGHQEWLQGRVMILLRGRDSQQVRQSAVGGGLGFDWEERLVVVGEEGVRGLDGEVGDLGFEVLDVDADAFAVVEVEDLRVDGRGGRTV